MRLAPVMGRRHNMAEQINWSSDFNSALRTAEQTGKPILLDFSAAPM